MAVFFCSIRIVGFHVPFFRSFACLFVFCSCCGTNGQWQKFQFDLLFIYLLYTYEQQNIARKSYCCITLTVHKWVKKWTLFVVVVVVASGCCWFFSFFNSSTHLSTDLKCMPEWITNWQPNKKKTNVDDDDDLKKTPGNNINNNTKQTAIIRDEKRPPNSLSFFLCV